MKIRKRNFKRSNDEQNFWPSFTDMISTIALILFILMLLAYIQNIISGKNLEFAKKELMDTQLQLESSNAEISQADKKLRLLKDQLEEVMAEVEAGQIALTLSEEQIREQQEIIAESNRELGEVRAKLKGIAVLRLDVLKKVKASIEEELGATNRAGQELVSIADNGNIIINEGLVFEYNSYAIKAEGKELLKKLSEAFEKVLDDSDIRANIDAISIQGHTDDIGSAEYNRDLSSKRASTVVNYLMSSNPTIEKKYGFYFVASGYSKFRPIASGTSERARAQNRRIEISLILKDSNVQNVIEEYMQESSTILQYNVPSVP
ncbi:OmpA family protein [Geosporobacter ferrireducens]|uniref:Flagellar motor protein MotB n=1 Tax=Geosporobacter ferrireducens TaxID=1424294 RepID=A0A1D8GFJ4_9FIRM|nr:OmpA family protein [Geosporobacter ferrireducens]AOT69673.1 flagellar motor protein MotB [Geosporobacter ferrireducens]MTI54621.1 flagellar motor protein MotB [Geosporobacter ferrireducens]